MRTLRFANHLTILILLIGACAKPPSQFYDALPGHIPISDQALFSKAIAHQKKGQIKLATNLWVTFLEKFPNSYEARNNLGLLHYANDQISQAIVQFEQGLNLELGSTKIKENLLRGLKVRVSILEENRGYDEAITDLKRIKQLSPVAKWEKIERQIENLEDKVFKQVKKSGLPEEYQEFLKKYPNSPKNSEEAILWLKETRQAEEIKVKGQPVNPEFFAIQEMSDVIETLKEETTKTVKESAQEGLPIIISKDFAEKSTPTPLQKIVEVIKSSVINVHSEPKIKSGNIIHKLISGTQVIYADENKAWYQVELANGERGWVIKKYTRLLD